jgi:chromosome segregation ATPase
MGLLVTLTELLGRLTIVTPLLERYLSGNRAAAGTQSLEDVRQSVTELSAAQSGLNASLETHMKEQQARMARIEDTAARVANRLAEMSNQRDTAEEEVRKLRGLLRATLTVVVVFFVVVLAAVTFLIFRGH